MRTPTETAWACMWHQPETHRRARATNRKRAALQRRLFFVRDAFASNLIGDSRHVRCNGLLQLSARLPSARNSTATPSSDCALASKRSRARSARTSEPNFTWPPARRASMRHARLPRADAFPRGKKHFLLDSIPQFLDEKNNLGFLSGCCGALGSDLSRPPHRLAALASRRGGDSPGSTPGSVSCLKRGAPAKAARILHRRAQLRRMPLAARGAAHKRARRARSCIRAQTSARW